MKDLKWTTGDFCWVDLMTTDTGKAKQFYTEIFNWNYDQVDTPDGPYIFSKIAEGAVGGMGELSAAMKDQNIPPMWTAYVMVDSADETVAKAKELGGNITLEPINVMDAGRMAGIAGPSGATLSIWETLKKDQETPRTFGMHHGMYGWVELATNMVDQDGQFFCNLFNWTPKTTDMPTGHTYTEFRTENSKFPAGGMMAIQKEWGDMPAHWSIYFSVNKMDETVSKITASGGKILVPPFEVPNVGTMAVAQDPTGASFSLSEWNLPESTDC